MKTKKRLVKESDLYGPVAAFLEREHGCVRGGSWTAGCGRDMAFPAGFGRRKPDVVAYKATGPKDELHLVEGKLLNLQSHQFDQTIAQLDSLCSYADRLWAAFPKSDWDRVPKLHEGWLSKLDGRRYGLLLVDGVAVIRQMSAMSHGGVNDGSRRFA